jgi:glycolate oxidase FAD binding subunit
LNEFVGAEHVLAGEAALDFSIDGQVAKAVAFPGSVEEVSAVMGFASAEGLKVAPRGSGTKMVLGGIAERVDLVLVLSRLNRLVEHEPADMTATFQAGISLKTAQAVLGRSGQFIALDPPYGDAATIGGILVTNSSGPRRLRYGAARDLLIATRVVHADGRVTKGGAKVVKNVSGYDMNKLYVGSLGTLGIIVEATFRLFPVPAVEKTYLAPFASMDDAGRVVARILDSSLVPTAIELLNPEASRQVVGSTDLGWPNERYGLAFAVGSVRHEAVDAQLQTARGLFREGGSGDGFMLKGQTHDAFWQAVQDFTSGDKFEAILKASVILTQVADGVKLGEAVAKEQNLRVRVVSEAGSGIIRYYLSGGEVSPSRFQHGVSKVITRLRAFAHKTEGSLVLLSAPPDVKSEVDVWGPVGNTLPLMKGLKEQFDPGRVLNPGRFVGGI